MSRILIPSYVRDIHATAVAAALEAKGAEPVVWHGADFPTRQTASTWFAADGNVRWQSRGAELDIGSERSFDVVWFRRPVTEPVLPEDMHAGDRLVAAREGKAFQRGLWHHVAPRAFWINPLGSRQRSMIKAVQLQEAASLGLVIPPTLFSNDPEHIREFLAAFPDAIFKPFLAALWTTDDAASYLFTSPVTQADLPPDETLRLSPGIFQQRIPKAHELRVTYLGDFAVSAKLLSQQEESAELDWRAAFTRLPVEPTEISPELDRLCRALMRRLGIVFGCFDFVVTPDGVPYFMEVNEMGQFLWLEEINPDLYLLDAFCEFLIAGRVDFTWKRSKPAVRFGEFREIAIRRQEEHDIANHVERPATYAVPDEVAVGAPC